MHSSPRPVPSSKAAFRSVRKTPGTKAFTQTLYLAHSTASDFVSDATADLLAEYLKERHLGSQGRDINDPSILTIDHRASEYLTRT